MYWVCSPQHILFDSHSHYLCHRLGQPQHSLLLSSPGVAIINHFICNEASCCHHGVEIWHTWCFFPNVIGLYNTKGQWKLCHLQASICVINCVTDHVIRILPGFPGGCSKLGCESVPNCMAGGERLGTGNSWWLLLFTEDSWLPVGASLSVKIIYKKDLTQMKPTLSEHQKTDVTVTMIGWLSPVLLCLEGKVFFGLLVFWHGNICATVAHFSTLAMVGWLLPVFHC